MYVCLIYHSFLSLIDFDFYKYRNILKCLCSEYYDFKVLEHISNKVVRCNSGCHSDLIYNASFVQKQMHE